MRPCYKFEVPMREPMNHELLTEDELAMPMGAGYPAAAKRLGLIYLADVVTLAHIIARYMEESLQLSEDYAAGITHRIRLIKELRN